MKRCLVCSEYYEVSRIMCPHCDVAPQSVDGFYAYAPDVVHEGSGFKSGYFAQLAELEEANFWFSARNRLIVWALKKYFPHFTSLIEVGCGTGYVLSGIASAFPLAELTGSDFFVAGLPFAATRLPQAHLIQMDARRIPYADEFDVAAAFDVLEHIEEDASVLENLYRAVRPGGGVMISVPQHRWLWSSNDDYACHVRRYSADELHGKMISAGFTIVHSTSFVSLLLPLMMLSRRRGQSNKTFDPLDELRISPSINSMLEGVLAVERVMIRMGIRFPMGGSRLIVARRPIGEKNGSYNDSI